MREFDGIAASNKFQMRSLYEFLAESDVAFEKPEVPTLNPKPCRVPIA